MTLPASSRESDVVAATAFPHSESAGYCAAMLRRMAKKRSGTLAEWVAAAAVPMLVVDERRRVRVFNRGMERFSGLPAGDVIGRRVPEAPGDDPAERFLDAVGFDAGLLAGPPRQVRTVFRLADGDRPATLLIVPLELPEDAAGGSRVLICVSEDRLRGFPRAAELADRAALRRAAAELRARYGVETFVGLSEAMRPVLRRLRAARESGASAVVVGPRGSGRTHAAMSLLPPGRPPVTLDAAALLDAEFPAALKAVAEDADLRETPLLIERAEKLRGDNQRLLAGHLFDARRRAVVVTADGATLTTELLAAAGDVRVDLPRLRDRGPDVRLLAHAFLERAAERSGVPVGRLEEAAMRELERYSWPGELVELETVTREAVAAAAKAGRDTVAAEDLPLRFRAGQDAERVREDPPVTPLAEVLEAAERRAVEDCLRRCNGNKSRAASLLGVSRPKFYHRLEALGIGGGPVAGPGGGP